jgi:hypothetical protein
MIAAFSPFRCFAGNCPTSATLSLCERINAFIRVTCAPFVLPWQNLKLKLVAIPRLATLRYPNTHFMTSNAPSLAAPPSHAPSRVQSLGSHPVATAPRGLQNRRVARLWGSAMDAKQSLVRRASIASLCLVAAGCVFAVVCWSRAIERLPEITPLRSAMQQSSFLTVEKIPLHVRQAFIAAEDPLFYKRAAVTLHGEMHATSAQLWLSWQTNQTKSPSEQRHVGVGILEQLVKSTAGLHRGGALRRRVPQILMAIKIQRAFSKDVSIRPNPPMKINQPALNAVLFNVTCSARVDVGSIVRIVLRQKRRNVFVFEGWQPRQHVF